MIKNSTKHQGYVTDLMGNLQTRYTKWYYTYKEAHDAAEKLAKKHFTDGRCDIGMNQK